MNLLLRLSICSWISVTLVSCSSAGSAGNLLMSPFKLLSNTLGTLGRTAGLSASAETPDTSSESVAERGRVIQQRGQIQASQPLKGGIVAQQ
jgi:hypothetical protein